MKITEFKISDTNDQLELSIEDAASVVSLRLWKDSNYKDISKAIDLSSKLTSSSNELITITLSDIGESYFDGVYFIEAEDDNELSLEYVYDLISYKECIMDKLNSLDKLDCLKTKNSNLLNAHSILLGLEDALEYRYINEILLYSKSLKVFCSNDCKQCKDKTIIDTVKQTDSETSDITIIVNGGNR